MHSHGWKWRETTLTRSQASDETNAVMTTTACDEEPVDRILDRVSIEQASQRRDGR